MAVLARPRNALGIAVWRWWCRTLLGGYAFMPSIQVSLTETDDIQIERGKRCVVISAHATEWPTKFSGLMQINLPSSWGLVREIELPAAASSHLQAVMAFEVERHTPFTANAVFFHADLLGDGTLPNTIRVRLTVVPRQRVLALLERILNLGGKPDRVVLEGQAIPLPVPGLGSGGSLSGVTPFLSWAMVLLAIMLAAYSAQWRYHMLLDENRAALMVARQQALDQAQGVEADAKQVTNLLAHLPQTWPPHLSLLLNELTKLLPDNAFVLRLQVDGATAHLEGQAESAAALVPLLEQSPIIDTVAFLAPTVRSATGPGEHFQFSIILKSEGPLP